MITKDKFLRAKSMTNKGLLGLIYKWQGKGREDEDGRSYWINLFQNVLGLENVTDQVEVEKKVVGADGNTI